MNKFEKRLTRFRLDWTWTGEAFTTIKSDFGFVVYYREGRNWLAVLNPTIVDHQLSVHGTKPPEITGFWRSNLGSYTERMFEIPVSTGFLTHVVGTAFPEILAL